MAKEKLSRRDFLLATAMTAVTAMVASCAKPDDGGTTGGTDTGTTDTGKTTDTGSTSKYKEAPALAAMVKAGTLPPVEERLPDEPMVVPVTDSIGSYGGTWRMATLGSNDGAIVVRTIAYEYLLRWDPMYTKVIPNLASSYEITEGGKVFTFNLRKGLKWSDGTPLTSADFAFGFNDVLSQKDLNPKLSSSLVIDGKECIFSAPDDYTIRYEFALPYGTFFNACAGTDMGNRLVPYPAHWMKQHHKDYADTAELDAKIKASGFETWVEYWGSLEVYPAGRYVGRPVLWGWVSEGENLGNSTEFICRRNPYYWKVDPEGNQLPYIDTVMYKVHEDKETILLAALAGEIDCQKRHIDRADAVALLQENSERSGYHFFELERAKMNSVILKFNQCTPTMELRPLFSNMDFRIALSYGLDRQEIIDVVHAGRAEPWQAAPLRSSPFFNENMAKRYTEYDPDKANEMLDKIIPQKDKDGFRMLPDGSKRLILYVETPSDFKKEWIDTLQIIERQWEKIGVDMEIKAEERSLFQERTRYDHDMAIWEGDIDYEGVQNVPWGPVGYQSTFDCWKDWFNTNGEQGEEPPQLAKDMNALYNELRVTFDETKKAEIIKQLQDMEPLWTIGTNTIPPGFGVVKNNFHNMMEVIPDLWIAPTIAQANPEQFWIES